MTKQRTVDLFGWGHDGQLPAEVHSCLSQPGALEAIADDLIRMDIADARKSGRPRGKRRPAESQGEMAAVAFVLTQYCHETGRSLPIELLDLLGRTLGIVIDPASGDPIAHPPLQMFGYPCGVSRDNIDLFLRAAQLEGEAIADGNPWANKALAQHLENDEMLEEPRPVDPKTLRNWKKSKAWQRRVSFVSNHPRIHDEAYSRFNSIPVRRPGGSGNTI